MGGKDGAWHSERCDDVRSNVLPKNHPTAFPLQPPPPKKKKKGYVL